jgi:hypothetical protein
MYTYVKKSSISKHRAENAETIETVTVGEFLK